MELCKIDEISRVVLVEDVRGKKKKKSKIDMKIMNSIKFYQKYLVWGVEWSLLGP